jgi:hypothetical protein
MKSGPSAGKTTTAAMSESSVGSSGEANSPVSFTMIENIIEEFDEIMGNLDLKEISGHSDSSENFGRSIAADFTTRSGGVSSNVHQVCLIITESGEDDDDVNTMIVNTQDGNPRISNRKEKEKIHVSAREWRSIMSTINHGTGIPVDSRREVLMGYQYTLHQHKNKLLEEKSKLMRSQ